MNIPKKSVVISIVVLTFIFSGIYFLLNYSSFFQNIFLRSKSSVEGSAKDYYIKGIELYKKNKFDKAIEAFKKTIALNPEYERAYRKLLNVNKENKSLNKAQTYFEDLAKQYPDNSLPLFSRGLIMVERKEYEKAIENLQQSIFFYPKLAYFYSALADVYYRSNQLEKGIEFLNNILAVNPNDTLAYYGLAYFNKLKANWDAVFFNLDKALHLDPDLLEALHLKITSLCDTGNFEEALKEGKLAFNLTEKIDAPELKISFILASCKANWYLGNFNNVLDSYEEALILARQLGDRITTARILNNIGRAYLGLGQLNKASIYLRQALRIYNEIGSHQEQGQVLGNLGDVNLELAEYDSALMYMYKALPIAREIKDRHTEANNLGSIAAVYGYLADYPKSFAYGDSALSIYRELGNRSGESNELGNFGANYIEQGNYSKALEYFHQAFAISKQIDDKYLQQIQLGGLANVYSSLNELGKAKKYLQEALTITREMGDINSEGACLINLATIEKEMGNITGAIKYLNQSLEIFIKIGAKRGEGIAYSDLANTYYEHAEYNKAQKNYEQALSIAREIGNRFGEAKTSNELGMHYQKLEKYPEAIALHQQALTIGKEIASLEIQYETNYALGIVLEKQGNIAEAIECYKQAIVIVEDIRSDFELEEQKSSFLENKIEIYDRLIHLYFMLNQKEPGKKYDEQAFCYAEKAKARALLDLLAEAKVNVDQTLDPDLLQRQKEIYRKISRLLTNVRDTTITVSQRDEIYAKLKKEEESLQNLGFKIKRQNPVYSNLKYPQPLTVADIQESMLKNNDLLLEYLLGKEQSYLWVVTKDDFAMFPLLPAKKIEQQVNHYLDKISPESYSLLNSLGDTLCNLLLKPVTNYIHNDLNLIIVPDGVLHYLAFEALPIQRINEKTAYLIDSCNVSYTPSSSVLHFIKEQDRETANKVELLAFGDPIFGHEAKAQTERVNKEETTERGFYQSEGFKFDRLPYTATEINNITKIISNKDYKSYLRSQATEEQVKAENLCQYRMLHFATHGLLDEQFPGRSSIVLNLDDDPSEDGFLQTNEIFNLRLDAALVVLSACQTGKGKLLNGEGIVGLSRAFFYAGSRSLVVSLWSVNDQSTAKFMEKFYQYMQRGQSKTEALRSAKLDFIKGKIMSWQHPFYWAPFVLQGEAN